MSLPSLVHHHPHDRAQRFVDEHHARGMRWEQIAFLARVLSVSDRIHVRFDEHGRRSLYDIGLAGLDRLAVRAKHCLSADDVDRFQTSLLSTWMQDDWNNADPVQALALARLVHGQPAEQWQAWQYRYPDAGSDRAACLEVVTGSMSSWILDNAAPMSTPLARKMARGELLRAAKHAGLHSLSWSAWRGGEGQEQALAQMIEQANARLQTHTGLGGGVLGLAGFVQLVVDDDAGLGGMVQMRPERPGAEAWHTMAGGRCVLSLPPDQGWQGFEVTWSTVARKAIWMAGVDEPGAVPGVLGVAVGHAPRATNLGQHLGQVWGRMQQGEAVVLSRDVVARRRDAFRPPVGKVVPKR